MGWWILVNFIRQPMLKLKTHSGFHDLFLIYTLRAAAHCLLQRGVSPNITHLLTVHRLYPELGKLGFISIYEILSEEPIMKPKECHPRF